MAYDFSETSPGGTFTAAITNAQLDTPGRPPTSTLTVTDNATGEVLESWTLGSKEFWTADPDANVIATGSFDVDKRCYTHDVWTGDYSPGTPLVNKEAREFCF